MVSPNPPNKRRRDPSPPPPSSPSGPNPSSPVIPSSPGDNLTSSLPASSPPPFEIDEQDLINDNVDDIDQPDEEDDGIDLFGEGMEADYEPNVKLDNYDPNDIDDEAEYEEMDFAERKALETQMAKRDAAIARREGRRPPAFLMDEEEEENIQMRPRRRRHYDEVPDHYDDENMDDEMPLESLADVKANSISEWISINSVRLGIMREFKLFLMTYLDDQGNSVYGQRIKVLGEMNSESLEVSFKHLADSKAILALFLANAPNEMLKIFDTVAMEVTLVYYPDYERIHTEIHVRITDLPMSYSLRDLRQSQLNSLIRVSGVVTRRSGVFPQLKYVNFNCMKCGNVFGPFYQDSNVEVKVSFCPSCESKGPFQINSEKTIYRNYQKMTLQESPGSVPAGRLPRHREIILLWDLIDSAKPGEEIEVTGIYRNNFDAALNTKNGFPVFATVIEANYINKKEDLFAAFKLTDEDEKQIRKLSKDERIGKRIMKSIAPSIYGHEDIKTAIALSLFGGVSKDINQKHRIRGDINVLLLGDPGTAKSQFLKYVEKTSHRAVFTTGQGASAVGLTASVRKDPITREWTLEGGALVLADKGTCLIDEFDKMNDQDRTSIHEAMEQQSISISKAGIVTTLQARCAIIAAANPIRGRYNPTIPFAANVELTEPILSRFDVLCVVKDTVDPVMDEMLAKFVVGSHLRSHPDFDEVIDEIKIATMKDEEVIDQRLLKKYIKYAREKCRPRLNQMDQDKLSKLYSDLRRESLSTGSFPITVRHLESMIRMSEASAKMHLRDYVRADDIDLAIRVTVSSFIQAQKVSVKRPLERSFRKYINTSRDMQELLSYCLGALIKEKMRLQRRGGEISRVVIPIKDFENRAKELEIFDINMFLKSRLFANNGYEVSGSDIVKIFT